MYLVIPADVQKKTCSIPNLKKDKKNKFNQNQTLTRGTVLKIKFTMTSIVYVILHFILMHINIYKI